MNNHLNILEVLSFRLTDKNFVASGIVTIFKNMVIAEPMIILIITVWLYLS